MSDQHEEKNLREDISMLKQKIHSARKDLNQLNQEKESLFGKREASWGELKTSIQQIKEIKKQLDRTTQAQLQLKRERDQWNKKCHDLVTQAKTLQQEKLKLFKKYQVKEDPQQLQQIIEKLEYKIETEVISLDKERKIMTKIKELKQKLKQYTGVQELLKKLHELSAEITTVKEKANTFHAKFIDELKKQQQYYTDFATLSKSISQQRSSHEQLTEQFFGAKKEFSQKNEELNHELLQVSAVATKMHARQREKTTTRAQHDHILLQEKAKVVEEKLKKGKKLTTQDLLVFQQQKS